TDFPADARVVAATARTIMATRFELDAAYQVIAGAPDQLANRDAAYFEIAIALRSMHLAYEVVPRVQGNIAEIFAAIGPEYQRVRADVLAYDASGAPRGKVLRTMLEIAEAAVPLAGDQDKLLAYARSLAPRGLALLEVAPQSADAWQIALAFALLSDDREA